MALSIFLLFGLGGYAQGDLLIFPKRLVFDGPQNKVEKVYLTNNGEETGTFMVSFKELQMSPEGKLVPLDTTNGNQNLASPYLRIYPRKVTLMPGESQVVKIQLVGARSLGEGEYRSHLYFRSVPDPNIQVSESPKENNADGISIKLNYVFGISIATIIHIGEPSNEVTISSLKFEKPQDEKFILSMDFERQGNFSSYGEVEIEYISPQGKIIPLRTIKGFAIYTPGNLRHASFDIPTLNGADFKNGQIKVSYSPNGKKVLYAQATLNL